MIKRNEYTTVLDFYKLIEKFIKNINPNLELDYSPWVNPDDLMPQFYSMPCFVKLRRNNPVISIDLYMENQEPLNLLYIRDKNNNKDEIYKAAVQLSMALVF